MIGCEGVPWISSSKYSQSLRRKWISCPIRTPSSFVVKRWMITTTRRAAGRTDQRMFLLPPQGGQRSDSRLKLSFCWLFEIPIPPCFYYWTVASAVPLWMRSIGNGYIIIKSRNEKLIFAGPSWTFDNWIVGFIDLQFERSYSILRGTFTCGVSPLLMTTSTRKSLERFGSSKVILATLRWGENEICNFQKDLRFDLIRRERRLKRTICCFCSNPRNPNPMHGTGLGTMEYLTLNLLRHTFKINSILYWQSRNAHPSGFNSLCWLQSRNTPSRSHVDRDSMQWVKGTTTRTVMMMITKLYRCSPLAKGVRQPSIQWVTGWCQGFFQVSAPSIVLLKAHSHTNTLNYFY